nr:MAG TPA_asm: hypothetical protein [Caudoviricetes sp.]
MEKSHYDGTKVETTQGWYKVKSLNTITITVLAAKYPNIILDQRTVKMRVNVQRLSPCWVTDLKIKVEILNICNNRSTAQSQME